MKNKNAILMTVKNQKGLTDQCLQTMLYTAGSEIDYVSFVDGSDDDQTFSAESISALLFPTIQRKVMFAQKKCTISEGWNEALSLLINRLTLEFNPKDSGFRTDVNIWYLNNDVVFVKRDWLRTLADRLEVEGTGLVGSSAMSVFGHPFATGGIWGTTLKIALEVAEEGKVLDERLNFAYQDVDLSVRIAKAGYVVTHVPNVELGDDPMMKHLVSKTVYANEGESNVMNVRAKEAEIFVQKHGRRE